jgi:spore coat polysaccharide biosynthesis protein SpsF (cytidylyltransferase family)/aryl-alcohol dehydrogenase-like predicted oxidoreductase
MEPIVLIQCRTSSSRLPGKALLPVRGVATSVLCAKRAANTGLDVKVVTSDDASDDELYGCLKSAQIACFRGDLRNVLNRFKEALDGVDSDTPVVRLTADNLFVDGALIQEVLSAYLERGNGYLTIHPPALTGTPYGLNVEVFSAGSLRLAHTGSSDEYDCEHVTPWIIRKYGLHIYSPIELRSNQSHLRCTLDSWDDYRKVQDVFSAVSDPLTATWQELCDHLHRLGPTHGIPHRFSSKGCISELALGTVQLGLPYGVANTTGKPAFAFAQKIVQQAIAHGVTHLDCAADYGDAEATLGRIVKQENHSQISVVTKLSALTELSETAQDEVVRSHVESSVYKSCVSLNVGFLPFLLLHRWAHRTSHAGRIWEILKQLKQKGLVKKLGASVQNPEEALQAVDDPDIQFIQIPFNLLDRRLQKAGFPQALEARKDVIIQARSVLLQGLLTLPAERWPKAPGLEAEKTKRKIDSFVRKFKRDSIADLCVAYVRSHSWIDNLVIGIESPEQLDSCVAIFQNQPLNANESLEIEEAFPQIPLDILDPSKWSKFDCK